MANETNPGYLVQLQSPEGDNVYPVVTADGIVNKDGSKFDPSTMLSDVGNLHVWRKTTVIANEIQPGYTLSEPIADLKMGEYVGETNSTSMLMSSARTISIASNGEIMFDDASASRYYDRRSISEINRFVKVVERYAASGAGTDVYYIPENGRWHNESNPSYTYQEYYDVYVENAQKVIPHGYTPAGTNITYLVSKDRNAYTEGNNAQKERFEIGEIRTGTFSITRNGYGSTDLMFSYSSDVNSIGVNAAGELSLSNTSSVTMNGGNSIAVSTLSVLKGKYVSLPYGSNSSDVDVRGYAYIPNDATFSQVSDYIVVDKYQPIIGIAAVPATETIEYIGQLGTKNRVCHGSYFGTGTSGNVSPCEITFPFPPKYFWIYASYSQEYKTLRALLLNTSGYSASSILPMDLVPTTYTKDLLDGGDSKGSAVYTKKSVDGKTLSWYGETNALYFNTANTQYFYIAIE